MVRKILVVVLLAAAVAAGVLYFRKPSSAAAPLPTITGLPVTVQLKQRSTAMVPGSGDRLSVSIDDITAGQVMVSIAQANGKPVLGSRSLASGASAPFEFEGFTYSLTLEKLDNRLIGDDSASLTISLPGGGVTEMQKIEMLITKVESLTGVAFIRNGEEHPPAHAGKLMRHKLGSMNPATVTANQFIDEAGTKSSSTGQPYAIKFADGRTVTSADFLREELAKLEAKK
jgi:hypothetical protein